LKVCALALNSIAVTAISVRTTGVILWEDVSTPNSMEEAVRQEITVLQISVMMVFAYLARVLTAEEANVNRQVVNLKPDALQIRCQISPVMMMMCVRQMISVQMAHASVATLTVKEDPAKTVMANGTSLWVAGV
jgi:hypothetical protein